ncbi:4-(cytidine 5'-diphospho)-2-C-methyl-D-erythritol kinase [Paraclostridium bifermentans]|uniref:4-(cytidine 5'-diphospho)-2-C-methyl-D-erythritol kinase n=1 Tax=Paraclostridium bifermentans TaxID=1490 RepID=UPI00051D232A|nr:4-(cytidine 5'-diphospho)-2-C-methyl-D-erythritol kinase [Paraclostridium bifermentans]KGJ48238.1 4-diphosphocytidyl-2C-methyl-D-erythritol kinase [Clostridium sp. NCR]MDV8113849.1 4-(cytidine 5'-diphospho)-2-C-methyl-D-erythritol kinase [Bacillus sp. BAU-SS-2023]TQO59809.1 4-(cytidine 5'-diphospho)-2-C-methyl-D-erythritol kinase [Paraclostridium bifermentans]UOW67820.1 4-(cytidine 5'-diphospho)-2-C-methyl-D-erythritol kinase [Paraclostridium bifermentans]GKZ04711.1 4-diphosphocytidyl-2-C-m
MNSIDLKSRAKVNLSIDVLGKREDGYHLVEMIMQTIDLYDKLKITEIEENSILIKSNSLDIPLNEDNIMYKAVNLLRDQFNIEKGIEISIEKNIPVAAGMAGGSSNAAAVLVGLNKLWNLGLSESELKDIGLKLGADVPFCITGGSALAEGIGEELTNIKGLPEDLNILVCKPNIFVSTKEVYQSLNMDKVKRRPKNKELIDALQKEDVKFISENMVNVLEEVTSLKYSEIGQIEDIMIKNKALGSMMSGSGPTVFGLFDNKDCAIKAKEDLQAKYNQVYLVKSSNKGVEIYG